MEQGSFSMFQMTVRRPCANDAFAGVWAAFRDGRQKSVVGLDPEPDALEDCTPSAFSQKNFACRTTRLPLPQATKNTLVPDMSYPTFDF